MASSPGFDRRKFAQLAAAAVGGLIAGTSMAAETNEEPKKDKKNPLLSEPHVCRGLNICKGKGKGGKNECAGQGACATAKEHTCKGDNECRGQGGCGAHPGENECKAMGECAVPLAKKATWEKARKRFEEVMKKEGKKVGPAPKG